tara:strand:- start:1071 stop:2975 length:1905 start_codon:yes stop_codon:yes gene_type:complete
MEFRKDINGLRAIAVVAVMLFHFNASWVPGGFAGVDVFFVISGFLMTGIILTGTGKGNFSILKFYIARANRIIPALAVLCLVLLVFGWFFLTPMDNKALGKHVGSSIGFFSNFIYWKEAGYFDVASHEKWLLHTWSLSVEWQFYIIYPLVIVAMQKFMTFKVMKATVLFGSILSFILGVIAAYKWPSSAYYLLPTRGWEMMIGGIAYLYPITLTKVKKKLVERLGIVLIASSYFLISKESPWPSYLALLPVLGSFLIIQAHRNDSFITSNIISQKIGAWSYSIYLWHWPLVVAIYHFSLNEAFIYLSIALSIILGFFSNKYIEKIKFKNNFGSLFDYLKCKHVYIVFIIAGCASYLNISNTINDIEVYDVAQEKYGYCFTSSGSRSNKGDKNNLSCLIGNNKKPPKILAFGDSFMGHYEPLLRKISLDLDISILSLTSGSCFPSFSKSFHLQNSSVKIAQCLMNRDFALANIDDFHTVIISTRWDEFYYDNNDYSHEVHELVETIINKGINVVFLPVPTIYNDNIGAKYIESIMLGEKFYIGAYDINKKYDSYNNNKSKELNERFAFNDRFIYIPKKTFFPEESFFLQNRTTPYSSDGAHISILGAERVWKTINDNGAYKKIKPLLNGYKQTGG